MYHTYMLFAVCSLLCCCCSFTEIWRWQG